MFVYAWVVIGKRRTLIFFAVSCGLSLTSELIGTGTGWPFGNYSYTDYLGYKVLDRVPFTIPLSWFYLGLAAYMLGTLLASRIGSRLTFWALFFGVWLLTAWDLVLDPAMADPSLLVKFWTWHESGPYFGMPIQNLVGWSVTGLLYMGVSRLLWRENMRPGRVGADLLVSLCRLRRQSHLRHVPQPGGGPLAASGARPGCRNVAGLVGDTDVGAGRFSSPGQCDWVAGARSNTLGDHPANRAAVPDSSGKDTVVSRCRT